MMRLINLLLITLVCLVLSGVSAFSQGKPSQNGRIGCPHCLNDGSPISQSLQKGDDLYARFKTKEALAEFFKVLELDPQNAEALSKIARVYIDFGDMIPESGDNWREKKIKEYRMAEDYARRAVKADPRSPWGYFYVAASLGSKASVSAIEKQIDLAGEIRSAVEKALALDPQNGFAYHIYGIWHRKMAEVGRASRFFASVLYGRSVPRGNMEKSIEYLKKAVALNPGVIASRLELARSYVAVEDWPRARDLLLSIRDLPLQFSDDAKHKEKAAQLLTEIMER